MAKVGIVMGSDSDLPVMAKAADILEEFGIDYEMSSISAHREPDIFFDYAKTAADRGLKVIIAGAGLAAHLPGMCAAIFPLPVIGVPMHTSSLGGRDSLYSIVQMPGGIPVATVAINGGKNAGLSLYSIVQMPGGIPVATVAINGGKNAGLLAVRMLAIGDDKLVEKLREYSAKMSAEVQKTDARLKETGYRNYTKE